VRDNGETRNQEAGSQVKSYDDPLFVLKYQKRKVIPMVVLWLLFFGLLGSYGLFGHVGRSTFDLIFARSIGFISLLICGAFVSETLLFKEIRLYRDRIVKAWKLIGTRELELAKVGLDSGMSISGYGAKYFFEQGMSRYWRGLAICFHSMGITYQEYFADEREVKRLNGLLAELTGRKVEEFEQMGRMERLIERGKM
jgi:hypothetical protein